MMPASSASHRDRGRHPFIIKPGLYGSQAASNLDLPAIVNSIRGLPSYGEGVPTVLLEAAACGHPIVATDIAGCREVVLPGQCGILGPVGDAESLSGAPEQLIRDPNARARMGRSDRKRVEAYFSQNTINERVIAIHNEALARLGP